MRTVRELRQLFLAIISVLAVVALVCAVYLLLPASGNAQQNQQQVQAARAQLKAEETQVIPLRGLDQKLVRSKQDIAAFYQNQLPDRYSQITQTLNDMASKNNVRLTNVSYKSDVAEVNDLQQVTMRATLSGRYGDVMRYIDSVDHARPLFLLDQVGVASQESGEIQLQLTLETFLRNAPAQGPVPTT
ncbi:MAG: hypothetical protein NVS9B15_19880 [Acidobacteriaceae bacterium]